MAEPEALAVLLVDDEPMSLRVVARTLERAGFRVTAARSGADALEAFRSVHFDAVLTDISMPGMGGVELLRRLRGLDPELPVLLLTASPSLETAIPAVNLGATGYLSKPVDVDTLREAMVRATRLGRLSRLRRQLVDADLRAAGDAGTVEDLRGVFVRALRSVWLAWQPIVRWSERRVYAYEALLRCREPDFPTPGALLAAAQRLDELHTLGRTIRSRVVLPPDPEALAFVNLHAVDLLDEDLYDPSSALAQRAGRVVLEITERADLGRVDDVAGRLRRLRDLGFRVAIDDLGAGYAGLTAFATAAPEVAKLDMTLVRGVDRDPIRQRLIGSMVPLCRDLGATLVAEGVETAAERDTLAALGCDHFQGFLFARPAMSWPTVAW